MVHSSVFDFHGFAPARGERVGVARLARYDARTGTTRLQIEAISRASAEQRKRQTRERGHCRVLIQRIRTTATSVPSHFSGRSPGSRLSSSR